VIKNLKLFLPKGAASEKKIFVPWEKFDKKDKNFPINIFNEIIDYSFLPENLIILAF
jgi:hypothetical protein